MAAPKVLLRASIVAFEAQRGAHSHQVRAVGGHFYMTCGQITP